MNGEIPACPSPFGDASIEFPVHFDIRIVYSLAENPDMQDSLEAALRGAGVPCTLIQGVAKPGARYGRMGARITVDSVVRMNDLYAAVAALPGVKAVI
jgi:hypothetical protein